MKPPDPEDGAAASKFKPRGVEFAKGALLPFPVFVALAVFGWSTLGTTTDLPLETFCAACALTVAGIVTLTVRAWNRSRWFAYGFLASFLVGLVLGGALVLLAMAALGSVLKG